MENEAKRHLLVVRLRPDEPVEIPAGATLVSSWLEPGHPERPGPAVLALVELRTTESEADAAWTSRWTIPTSAPPASSVAPASSAPSGAPEERENGRVPSRLGNGRAMLGGRGGVAAARLAERGSDANAG